MVEKVKHRIQKQQEDNNGATTGATPSDGAIPPQVQRPQVQRPGTGEMGIGDFMRRQFDGEVWDESTRTWYSAASLPVQDTD